MKNVHGSKLRQEVVLQKLGLGGMDCFAHYNTLTVVHPSTRLNRKYVNFNIFGALFASKHPYLFRIYVLPLNIVKSLYPETECDDTFHLLLSL